MYFLVIHYSYKLKKINNQISSFLVVGIFTLLILNADFKKENALFTLYDLDDDITPMK